MNPTEFDQKIILMRGGDPVRSLLGSFGSSLKETRLTGMLGFLMAQYPKPWQELFGIVQPITEIRLEADQKRGRADIWLETSNKKIVIEAKVSETDPTKQANKYKADRDILISNHIPTSSQISRQRQYINWDEIAKFLQEDFMAETGIPSVKYLATEVLNYMKETGLVRSASAVEIYAREINNEMTLDLFLRGRLYGCNYQKGSKIAQSLYFAPNFGKQLAQDRPSVFPGISFIAKIEAIAVTETWKNLIDAAKKYRGGQWLNQNFNLIRPLHSAWKWKGQQRTFLFLSTPRLVFNPPINKDLLQRGKGWLSRHFFSFDELFEAWGRSGSAKVQ